jgi:hypothetical protein
MSRGDSIRKTQMAVSFEDERGGQGKERERKREKERERERERERKRKKRNVRPKARQVTLIKRTIRQQTHQASNCTGAFGQCKE